MPIKQKISIAVITEHAYFVPAYFNHATKVVGDDVFQTLQPMLGIEKPQPPVLIFIISRR